jgi:ABC-type lipoprotein export system ATPase subunit
MKAIVARDVFYLYRSDRSDVAALRGLSVELDVGEVASVLGPSGSGKSTLLRLCAGDARPSSGQLELFGLELSGASARARGRLRREAVGIVRQHYQLSLPQGMTAEEVVCLPQRLVGINGRVARVRAGSLLRAAGLYDRRRARVSELSGGEQQRVAICAALSKRPRLLLADEPTGELDPTTSARVVELLLELAAEDGTSALIVTHDPEVALRTARTIHIRDGRLAAEGLTRPVLIVDEGGWLRLPRALRDEAGLSDRVRAAASAGRIELIAVDPLAPRAPASKAARRPSPAEKRYQTEAVLDHVSKRYGSQQVVSQLSWTFAAEKLHVLAGASGSGKTTLINLLAALERPDSGRIWVGGVCVDGLAPDEAAAWRRGTVGYISQHSTLTEFLSVQENVALALTFRGYDQPQADLRAGEALEWVGLADIAARRAGELSGGEQRRAAFARAMAPDPRLLIADEPTAHLDRLSGRLLIRLLRQAAEHRGTTIIAASHDPDLISVADSRLSLGSDEERASDAMGGA